MLQFSCCGVRIGVDLDGSVTPAEICTILPPGSELIQCESVEHRFSSQPPLDVLRKKIHLCVAEYARDWVFVHSGVVGWNGRAYIFPGRSFAGKSTLVMAFIAAGATYYSDEYAVFDREGKLHPFPLPIHTRQPSGARYFVAIKNPGVDPISTGAILFARYRQHGKWQPRKLTPGETMMNLLKNSVSIRRNPETVLSVLGGVARTTPAYSSVRGQAENIIHWVASIAV